jgi:nucleotide-binding universal stress UspA family protein
MKKILCPTDFSDTAQNAIAYAAKFTKATNAMLTLLNVQAANSPAFVSEKALLLNAVTERLEEVSKEVRQFFKISCEAEIVQSPSLLSETIAQRADDFDMIVMGTHGVESLMEFFTGSNTYHAIRKSRIPVMLIPPDCAYSEIKGMVYAYNYLAARQLPLKQLQPWIKALQCELTVLQVNEEAISEDVNEEMKELQFIITEQWKGENMIMNFDAIRSSEIAPSIHSYIQRNEQDVLALCTTHRNFIQEMFHKSVIKVISEIACYPVLVFHE